MCGGGHAGHNGVRSIHDHIGEAYQRVRMGVGHAGRKEAVAGYVLHDFAKAEEAAGSPLPVEGTVLISVIDPEKPAALKVARRFAALGFRRAGTAAHPGYDPLITGSVSGTSPGWGTPGEKVLIRVINMGFQASLFHYLSRRS